jgi:hypothetical protein
LIRLLPISTPEIFLIQKKIAAAANLESGGRHTILTIRPEKSEKCQKDRTLLIAIVSDSSTLPAINLEIHSKSEKIVQSASKKVHTKVYLSQANKQSPLQSAKATTRSARSTSRHMAYP